MSFQSSLFVAFFILCLCTCLKNAVKTSSKLFAEKYIPQNTFRQIYPHTKLRGPKFSESSASANNYLASKKLTAASGFLVTTYFADGKVYSSDGAAWGLCVTGTDSSGVTQSQELVDCKTTPTQIKCEKKIYDASDCSGSASSSLPYSFITYFEFEETCRGAPYKINLNRSLASFPACIESFGKKMIYSSSLPTLTLNEQALAP